MRYLLGELYFQGNGVAINKMRARTYFQQVEAQKNNVKLKLRACYYLALLSDESNATHYMDQIEAGTDNWARWARWLVMGINYFNDNSEKAAVISFETLRANHSGNLWADAFACFYLGRIYLQGSNLIARDNQKAYDFLKEASKQTVNLKIRVLLTILSWLRTKNIVQKLKLWQVICSGICFI
jgi:TPR repeat protein